MKFLWHTVCWQDQKRPSEILSLLLSAYYLLNSTYKAFLSNGINFQCTISDTKNARKYKFWWIFCFLIKLLNNRLPWLDRFRKESHSLWAGKNKIFKISQFALTDLCLNLFSFFARKKIICFIKREVNCKDSSLFKFCQLFPYTIGLIFKRLIHSSFKANKKLLLHSLIECSRLSPCERGFFIDQWVIAISNVYNLGKVKVILGSKNETIWKTFFGQNIFTCFLGLIPETN